MGRRSVLGGGGVVLSRQGADLRVGVHARFDFLTVSERAARSERATTTVCGSFVVVVCCGMACGVRVARCSVPVRGSLV